MTDVAVDLRVDDHAEPIAEPGGSTTSTSSCSADAEEEWMDVHGELAEEIRVRLAELGYADESLEKAFNAWVGTENLEERVKA